MAGKLALRPAANDNGAGVFSFNFQVQDDGGTANGGVDPTRPRTRITIDVTAVNDAPSFAVGADQTVNEDSGAATRARLRDLDQTGPADESGQTVDFTVTNDDNALFSGQPAIAPNGTLTFTPAANANGAATVTVSVTDDGGTANGGDDTSDTQTFTITVRSVNDAPSGTDNTVQTDESTAYVFTAGDFGFGDADGNDLEAVRITTLPIAGGLTLDGNAVSAGDVVQVGDIALGLLVFTPDADESGEPYATFTFQVRDDGGTAFGGADLDPSANTMSIDVGSINDAPTGTDGTVTVAEDGSHTFTVGDFGFSDTTERVPGGQDHVHRGLRLARPRRQRGLGRRCHHGHGHHRRQAGLHARGERLRPGLRDDRRSRSRTTAAPTTAAWTSTRPRTPSPST